MTCPACGRATSSAQRFCGHCGAALDVAGVATATSTHPPAVVTPVATPADAERFLPGMMLAGRYRVVGLLGRGGMGEVYRADDLKLGQPVALKFLPRNVERDAARRERFLDEVRLALRVTHPNVCRVFDIAEVDGRQFLSMEYVDGEDLASLLRRIGRLPEDKAIEIARQLCAGLAAAHDEGVLHRDLKPGNVMIDGRGRAKITDFGLAGATTGISGVEARAGTPQYMAPEQVAGGHLSVQTDLYALGLVLYELFTGKRAYEAKTLDELVRLQSSTPTSPAALVIGLDLLVERAILRCLDPDPARRPASASALAAALPGGDPLAMAIAAGETPSPEMVARAGGKGALTLPVAAVSLLIVLGGLATTWIFLGRTALQHRIPLQKPPAELMAAARSVIAASGHTDAPEGQAYGFATDAEYFRSVTRNDWSVRRWDNLGQVTPSPLWFWYRDRAFAPSKRYGTIAQDDPPMTQPGMVRVRLNPAGQLLQFHAVPPQTLDSSSRGKEPEWTSLFTAAGLSQSDFSAAEPQWSPPFASDVHRAWTKGDVRVEGASLGGRPVWFAIIPSWRTGGSDPNAAQPLLQRAVPFVFQALTLGAIIAGALLARRNMRLDRSDRRGALRLAAAYLAIGIGIEVLKVSGAWAERYATLSNNIAAQVMWAAIVWLFYNALEPYVRRLWPNTLIAWSRVLEGRFRDPLVGRHVLIGAVAGIAFSILFATPEIFGPMLGVPAPAPRAVGLGALSGTGRAAAAYLVALQESLFIPVSALLGVLLARAAFRPSIAYALLLGLVTATSIIGQPGPAQVLSTVGVAALVLVLLVRLGLLAFLVGILFSSWHQFPLTTNPDSWYFPSSVVTMALFAGVAVYAFVVALGGQNLFKGSVFDDGAR